MTLQEFSIEFDILYNNISSNQAPGLTEYEKSVFLTQAQEALVLDLYKGTTGDSFETTEEVTRYLSTLVKSFITTHFEEPVNYIGTPEYVVNFQLNNLWFITFQSATIVVDLIKSRDVLVVPAKQDSLYKDLKNPFKRPDKNKIFVINEDGKVKLYSNYPITRYVLKYLSKPSPIILSDLESEWSINGISNATECSLPESLHRQILLRAVQMAKAVWQS